jgi:hypothetical protein
VSRYSHSNGGTHASRRAFAPNNAICPIGVEK